MAASNGAAAAAYALASLLVFLAAGGRTSRLTLAVALALGVGAFVGSERLRSIDAPTAALHEGDRITGTGEVLTPPDDGHFGRSVEIRMLSGRAAGARLLARLDGASYAVPLPVGGRLAVSGRFRPRDETSDFGRYLQARGVGGELEIVRARTTGAHRDGWRGTVDGIRGRAQTALTQGLDERQAALARGTVLGDDADVPPSTEDDFQDSGLAHLLAASGSNVALLCALAIPLLAAAGLPYGARVAVLTALVAIYVPLAGSGPSIQRAGVMAIATLAATALARPASRTYALGLAACVTLALDPRACFDPGWQLSFAAVTGILVLAPGLARRLGALPRPLADAIALTVAATVATAPLIAHHFGTVALAGLPANVLAVPLVAPIMWLGMLRAGLGQLAALDGPVAAAADVANAGLGRGLAPPIRALEWLAAQFADIPGGQVDVRLDGGVEVLVAYLGLAAGVMAARRIAAPPRHVGVERAVAWLGDCRARGAERSRSPARCCWRSHGLAASRRPAPPGRLTVSFLDVGQGDATLIQHPDGSAVLFDGGPPEGRVARLLRRAGVRRLSRLVLTHASRDHHGGLARGGRTLPGRRCWSTAATAPATPRFASAVAAAARRGARAWPRLAPLAMRAGGSASGSSRRAPRPPGPPRRIRTRARWWRSSARGLRPAAVGRRREPGAAPARASRRRRDEGASPRQRRPWPARAARRLRPEVAGDRGGREHLRPPGARPRSPPCERPGCRPGAPTATAPCA